MSNSVEYLFIQTNIFHCKPVPLQDNHVIYCFFNHTENLLTPLKGVRSIGIHAPEKKTEEISKKS